MHVHVRDEGREGCCELCASQILFSLIMFHSCVYSINILFVATIIVGLVLPISTGVPGVINYSIFSTVKLIWNGSQVLHNVL